MVEKAKLKMDDGCAIYFQNRFWHKFDYTENHILFEVHEWYWNFHCKQQNHVCNQGHFLGFISETLFPSSEGEIHTDIYRPQRSWGKVIFSQASVILSTGGGVLPLGGGCASSRGGASSGGGCFLRGCLVETPLGRLLLWAVRILLECILVTGRNEVVAKVMFLQVCVCPRGGRVSASVHAGMPDPPRTGRHPPRTRQTSPWDQADTPPRPGRLSPPGPGRHPPGPGRHPRPPQDQAGPPGKQTPAYGLRAAGTHPTGMHSCYYLLFRAFKSILAWKINCIAVIKRNHFHSFQREPSFRYHYLKVQSHD